MTNQEVRNVLKCQATNILGEYASICECMKFGDYVMVSKWQNYCNNCLQAIDWSEVE